MTDQIKWNEIIVKINDLKDYDKNPRTISKLDFKRLVNDLQQDGYHKRIIIDCDNTIIGGHSRKKALLAAGYKKDDEIKVLQANRKLTESEFQRLNIRDNLSFGDFDLDGLANNFNLPDLLEWGIDPNLFQLDLLQEIPEENEEILEPEEHKPAKTVLGDIYILGNHRLMCGDSTNATQVQQLLANNNPNLMVTDPPYGVNYDATHRGKNCSSGKVLNDHKADWTDAYSLFSGNVAYVWHASLFTSTVQKNLEECGFVIKYQIIWNKQHLVLGRGDYHYKHEPCFYAVKKGAKHNWQGARDQATVWDIKNNSSNNGGKEEQTGHSTQKPIQCMLRPILNNSAEGDYVYDPFGGSGTTLIAAEQSKRKCLMMELSPHYCDIIVERWEKQTGLKAILEK